MWDLVCSTLSLAAQALPSVYDALHSPPRSSDIFDQIPANCIHSISILIIWLFRAASQAWNADYVRFAFLPIHLFLTAVLRRSLGWDLGGVFSVPKAIVFLELFAEQPLASDENCGQELFKLILSEKNGLFATTFTLMTPGGTQNSVGQHI